MAKTLNSLTIAQPATDPAIAESGNFTFEVTPGFTGGGPVTAYDLQFEYDQGTGSWTAITGSGGLTTADTNPVTGLTTESNTSITVTGVTTDVYQIRVTSTTGPTTSGTQQVTVGTPAKEVDGALSAQSASVTGQSTRISVATADADAQSASIAGEAAIVYSAQGALEAQSADITGESTVVEAGGFQPAWARTVNTFIGGI